MIDQLPSDQYEKAPEASLTPRLEPAPDVRPTAAVFRQRLLFPLENGDTSIDPAAPSDVEQVPSLSRAMIQNFYDDWYVTKRMERLKAQAVPMHIPSEEILSKLEELFRAYFAECEEETLRMWNVRFFNRAALCMTALLLEHPDGLNADELSAATGYSTKTINQHVKTANLVLNASGKRIVSNHGTFKIV